MYKEVAQYVAARRKAVQMQADFGQSYLKALKAVNAKANVASTSKLVSVS